MWGCFCYRETGEPVRVNGVINADTYIDIIRGVAIPGKKQLHPDGYVYQQEKAPPHTADRTVEFLLDSNVDVIDWLARSPDLNLIENLCGELLLQVYAEYGQ